jgi:hypothetical protein
MPDLKFPTVIIAGNQDLAADGILHLYLEFDRTIETALKIICAEEFMKISSIVCLFIASKVEISEVAVQFVDLSLMDCKNCLETLFGFGE